jgi:hypothetical protein
VPERPSLLPPVGRAATAKNASRGKPAVGAQLATDAGGEPTVLESGPVSFYVIKRRERFAVRVKNSRSPVLRAFGGLPESSEEPLQWPQRRRREPRPT